MPRALHLAVSALLISSAACTTNGGNTFLVATKVVMATGTIDPVTKLCVGATLSASSPEVLPSFKPGTELFGLGIVVDNRLPTTVTSVNRLQSNDWVADTAVISYESTGSGAVNVPERTYSWQGYVPASASAVTTGRLISSTDSTLLAAATSIRIRMHLTGKLNDGSTAQTSDYEFLVLQGDGSTCSAK
jgi:hypothetical protein